VIFGSFPTAFIGFGMQADREWRRKKPPREEGFDYSKNSCFGALPVKRNQPFLPEKIG
jgi:hypothetical protein